MVNSGPTFEHAFRSRLLDVIYAQWSQFGAPFCGAHEGQFAEVIDPEALVWVSLEFLPTEPRLAESAVLWLGAYRHYTIHQRLKTRLRPSEPRTHIWLALEQKEPGALRPAKNPGEVSEPCYGLDSPQELARFAESFRGLARNARPDFRRIGTPVQGPATSLLRARDLLGRDARHLLLLYLLANPHGAALKPLQQWTGYTSRAISDTVARWRDAEVVSLEHGICRLLTPGAWEEILRLRARHIALVNWFSLFDASVRLLRALAKARRAQLPEDSSVVVAHKSESRHAIASSGLNESGSRSAAVRHLLAAFDP